MNGEDFRNLGEDDARAVPRRGGRRGNGRFGKRRGRLVKRAGRRGRR